MGKTLDVLVVEDDAALNKVICRLLGLSGFTVRSALDGATALRLVRERAPSLVLLDMMLPDTTGLEVCEEIKCDLQTGHVPVVFVTALADSESKRRGMACGASTYLVKPFDFDELIDVCRKSAGKSYSLARH